MAMSTRTSPGPSPDLSSGVREATAKERERQEAQRQQDLEELYPCYESGDTGNSEWAYRRDTQKFVVAWVGDRPRWPG